jgi:hypothetical protein
MKRVVFAFALAMAMSAASFAFAQDKCTVSGEVVYSGDSNLYVCLLNSTTFAVAVGPQKEISPPGFVQIVKANASGKASFASLRLRPEGGVQKHSQSLTKLNPFRDGDGKARSSYCFV